MTPSFKAKINQDSMEIGFSDIIALKQYLLSLRGCEVEVSIEKVTEHRTRSRSQNRYYWFILNILGKFLGYTSDELHVALRLKFLPQKGDNILIIPKSTTDLTAKEFTEYIDNIRKFSLDKLNCYLPTTNEIV